MYQIGRIKKGCRQRYNKESYTWKNHIIYLNRNRGAKEFDYERA